MMKSLRVLLVVSAVGMASVAGAPPAGADVPGAGAGAPAPRKASPRVVVGGKRVVKAGGDSRAWTTLKAILPASTTFAGELNVAAVRGSETFTQLKRLVSRESGLRELMDVTSACQLDLGEAVQDIAFATVDAAGDHLVMALSFKGVVEADLVSCVEAAEARKHPGAGRHVETHRSGGVTEYAFTGEADKLYAAWLAPDVVVFSDRGERASLDALLAQKGGLTGTSTARRALAAIAPGAVAFVVYLKSEQIESYELRRASASITLSGGRLGLDVSLALADADSARRAAADWAAQRDQLAQSGGGVPAALGQMLKAVQIAAADDVVHVTVQVVEKDFLGAFPLF